MRLCEKNLYEKAGSWLEWRFCSCLTWGVFVAWSIVLIGALPCSMSAFDGGSCV